MTHLSAIGGPRALRRLRFRLGVGVASFGCLVLVGWLMDVDALKRVMPGCALVQANAALSFALLGIASMLLLQGRLSPFRRFVGCACAGLTCLLAGITLAEYLLQAGVPGDRLLFGRLESFGAVLDRGRMSFVSALLFLMIAAALILQEARRLLWLAELLAVSSAFVCLMALTGEAFRFSAVAEGARRLSPLPAVTAFLCLAAAVLVAIPERGLMAVVLSKRSGGGLARRLLLAAVLVPVFAGWLRLQGQQAGYLRTESGIMFFVLTNMVTLSALTVYCAQALNRLDANREQATEDLRRSERRFRAIIENSDVVVTLIAPNGAIRYVSPAVVRMLGYTPDELVGINAFTLLHPDDVERLQGRAGDARSATGSVVTDECRVRRNDGSWLWVEATGMNLLTDPDVEAVVGNFRDITARRVAEESLRASEARVRLALSAARMVAWEWDLGAETITFSEQAADVLGLQAGAPTVGAEEFASHLHPIDRQRRRAAIEQALEKCESYISQFRFTRPDNRAVVWVEGRGHLLCEQDGAASRFVGIHVDITDRMQAEATLLHFKALFESAPGMYLVLDPDFTIVAASDAYLRATMTERDQILGRDMFDVFPDDPVEPGADGVRNLRASLERVKQFGLADTMAVQRYPIRRPDSEGGSFEERYWSPFNSPVFGPHGELFYIIHRVEDVTEYVRTRRLAGGDAAPELESRSRHMEAEIFLRAQELARANADLRRSEERYRELFENNPHPMWVFDCETSAFLAVNDTAIERYGYSREEFLAMSLADIRPSEDVGRLDLHLDGQFSRLERHGTWRHRWKDGAIRDVEVTSHDLVWEGRPARLVLANDVTERERAERELRDAESRFRLLVEQSIVGFYIIQGDRFTYANPALEEVLGFSFEELTSRPVLNFIAPEDRPLVQEKVRDRLDGRATTVRYQFRMLRWDGAAVYVEVHGSRAEHGGGPAIIGVLVDVTERKLAESALRESEQKYRFLADSMPQIVWTARPDGVIEFRNRQCCDYTGLRPEQTERRDWQHVIHPDDRDKARDAWERACGAGEPYEIEYRIRRVWDGEHRWHLGRALPRRDDVGVIVQWVGTATDIDDHKRAQESLERLNAELERRVQERTRQLEAANRELESFSYSVSHDLRAPLRAIDGFARILQETSAAQLPEPAREYLQEVRDSARDMGQLIDDLLAFARLGRQSIMMHTVQPRELVRQCLHSLRPELEGRRVEFAIGDLAPCRGDTSLLKQVWTNLLSNAIKYTRKKDPARIELGSREAETEGWVTYYVRDNGVGFDMRYAHKLFGVFQRLHRADEYEGTGVGLATVHRIIHRHGGRIWAEARPAEGATFCFTLRRADCD